VKSVEGTPTDDIDFDAERTIIGKALLDMGDSVKVCWTPSARPRDLGRSLAGTKVTAGMSSTSSDMADSTRSVGWDLSSCNKMVV
jgi:hypothetical protein